jgi:ribosomal protein S6--L-glutamate ligase
MRIGILSRNAHLYSTARIVEAAEKRGHQVQVIDHQKCVLVIESSKPRIIYKGEELPKFDAIIPRIGASVTFYGAAVVRQFEQMHTFSTLESQALVRSRDKLRSLQLLAKAGLGMPKTAFASNPKNIDDVLNQVGGAPVVIKLLEGTQGIGVILAETRNSAKSVIEAFLDVEVNILVQEFIADCRRYASSGC